MKILIIGDSFATDWSSKYPGTVGWPNLLAEKFNVTNLAQAGVSEYRIYQQLKSVKDLNQFDLVIVSHTSPYRVPTQRHPIHANDLLHANADLIFGDIEFHSKKFTNWFNKSLQSAINFFKYHYDEEYQEISYMLFRNKIHETVGNTKCIIIDTLCVPPQFVTESTVIDIREIAQHHSGLINHLSEQGNFEVYNKLLNKINELK